MPPQPWPGQMAGGGNQIHARKMFKRFYIDVIYCM